MVFAKNQVFRTRGGRVLRILWHQACEAGLWYIDTNDHKALPQLEKREMFVEQLISGDLTPIADTSVMALPDGKMLTAAEQRGRDKAWSAISEIVKKEPDVYLASDRARLIADVVRRSQVSRPTVYLYLRRFWQRGGIPNATIPDYRFCGAKGAIRSPGARKRGRPRDISPGKGLNIDEAHRRIMRAFWTKRYLKTTKGSLHQAHENMLGTAYPEFVERSFNGKRTRFLIKEPDKVPAFEQFRYWYEKETHGVGRAMRRGLRSFEKQFRMQLDNVRNEVNGPGTRYQIDSTVADIYLVSRYARNRIVGRVTLYLVVDTYSSMIVGFSVGLGPPCYVVAMVALLSVLEDKVQLCGRYGIEIEKEEWPNSGMCRTLLADRAELFGHASTALVKNLNIEIENAAPYRGDSKSIVEQSFRTIHAEFAPYAPGYVEKDYKERGGTDYRLDAKLNLDDFSKVIIYSILSRNNKGRRDYPGTHAMLQDSVPYVPVALWEWGLKSSHSDMRWLDYKFAAINLMPSKQAQLGRRGIRFCHGVYYHPGPITNEPWFLNAVEQRQMLEVLYDPLNLDRVMVRSPHDRNDFYDCTLAPHCQRFAHLSEIEVNNLRRREREIVKETEIPFQERRLGYVEDMNKVIADAVKSADEEYDQTISKTERTKNINKNRSEEIERSGGSQNPFDTVFPPPLAVETVAPLPDTAEEAHQSSHLKALRELTKPETPS